MAKKYKLIKVNIAAGEDIESGREFHEASVVIAVDGKQVKDAAIGNGMVDAAYKAIERALKIDVQVVHFSVQAIGDGSGADGQVIVQIEDDGCIHEGVGRKSDIVIAGVYAFMDALNKKAQFANTVMAHTI